MRRGEIWWARLPAPNGSGPGFRRPVVVVSSDSFNKSAIATVIVAVITSNQILAGAPGNVELTLRQSKLPKPSVVNVSQLLTIDRSRLAEKVTRIPQASWKRVESGLRLVLGLN